uniref:Uncharacterized protein n=1 Tax=Parascaris univalens TaxID=6257 RepID=A0A915A567_PARUN
MMKQKKDSGSVSTGFDSQHFSSQREISCDSAMPTPPTASKREAATLKDLQKCGGYIYFLTVTYAMMVFSQTINLIFMTFAALNQISVSRRNINNSDEHRNDLTNKSTPRCFSRIPATAANRNTTSLQNLPF